MEERENRMRGELIAEENILKYKIGKYLFLSLGGIIICFSIFSSVFLWISGIHLPIYSLITFIIIFAGIQEFAGIYLIFYSLCTARVRVYENGFTPARIPLKNCVRKVDYFIPWSEVIWMAYYELDYGYHYYLFVGNKEPYKISSQYFNEEDRLHVLKKLKTIEPNKGQLVYRDTKGGEKAVKARKKRNIEDMIIGVFLVFIGTISLFGAISTSHNPRLVFVLLLSSFLVLPMGILVLAEGLSSPKTVGDLKIYEYVLCFPQMRGLFKNKIVEKNIPYTKIKEIYLQKGHNLIIAGPRIGKLELGDEYVSDFKALEETLKNKARVETGYWKPVTKYLFPYYKEH